VPFLSALPFSNYASHQHTRDCGIDCDPFFTFVALVVVREMMPWVLLS
jgi:hypothetical protein